MMNRIFVLIILLIIGCVVSNCESLNEKSIFWPTAETIYSPQGDSFHVKRISKDTLRFRLSSHSVYSSFFWDSGKITRNGDTILFKLDNGSMFSPLFVTNSPMNEIIHSSQPIFVDVGSVIGVSEDSLVYSDTINFTFKKIYERWFGKRLVYVFQGKSPLLRTSNCLFVVDDLDGISGILFVQCEKDQKESPRQCQIKIGLGRIPVAFPITIMSDSLFRFKQVNEEIDPL